MCQHALYGVIRKKPDAIFAYNLNKFKRLDIDGILLYGCRSFVDDDARLKVENDPCSMDQDSFRQRGVSLKHIHRLATTLGIHHEYVEMVVKSMRDLDKLRSRTR
jgi:coenzyme F420-reducing hydrogenase delta subunit